MCGMISYDIKLVLKGSLLGRKVIKYKFCFSRYPKSTGQYLKDKYLLIVSTMLLWQFYVYSNNLRYASENNNITYLSLFNIMCFYLM